MILNDRNPTDSYLEVCVVHMFKNQSRGPGLKVEEQVTVNACAFSILLLFLQQKIHIPQDP